MGWRRATSLRRVHEHLQPQVLDEGVTVLRRVRDRVRVRGRVSGCIPYHSVSLEV